MTNCSLNISSKNFPIILSFFFISAILIFYSCKKEYSCENCAGKNKPPIANAGPDHVITLPTDSVLLNGSNSRDPDGIISSYLWTKISGPSSFNIVKPTDSITKLKSLVVGTYKFELKVTDNGGLSAKDTTQVIVNDPPQPNRPPIANAGADQTISLPTNTITLNGNGSTDADNNITSYAWSKISGPSSFNIVNANIEQTQVANLIEGVYQFELKVTDAGGLFSTDTVKISVNFSQTSTPCSRPVINAQLVPFGNLSKARDHIVTVFAGNKILFAGGYENPNFETVSTIVDIYDTSTHVWSVAKMSIPRSDFTAVSHENKIYLAGGFEGDCQATCIGSNRIDVYDALTNTWSVSELSIPRGGLKSASVADKVLFAGGDGDNLSASIRVDIYNSTTNTWAFDSLSKARGSFSATTSGSKIYFAGGGTGDNSVQNNIVNTIDIYDNSTGGWTNSQLTEPKAAHASIAVGNKIYWASGFYLSNINGVWMTTKVEIRDVINQTTSFAYLCKPTCFFFAVLKNNKIIFFHGGDSVQFEVYDITTDTWSTGSFNQSIRPDAIISVNNTIYVAGGYVNGILSNQVWKLEF